MPEELASPLIHRRRFRWLWWTLVAFLLIAATIGGRYYWQWRKTWTALVPDGLPPSGGLYFLRRLEIPVPQFRQSDTRWGDDVLGPMPDNTLASHGCAVASTAMILASYNIDTDPQRLNDFLANHQGYTPQGWLKWEVAASLAPDKVKFIYEDLPSFQLIDDNLSDGNPVIVRIRFSTGMTHFVVIAGKQGLDYLVRDPGARANLGLYPLKELGCPIEALRFYRRT